MYEAVDDFEQLQERIDVTDRVNPVDTKGMSWDVSKRTIGGKPGNKGSREKGVPLLYCFRISAAGSLVRIF